MATNPANINANPLLPSGNPAPQIIPSPLHIPGGSANAPPQNNVKPLTGGNCNKKMSYGGKSRKGRKLSGALKEWNVLVSDVFNKGRAKNSKYTFKRALKDASRMKKKNKTMKK
jgi:hypothetical protein